MEDFILNSGMDFRLPNTGIGSIMDMRRDANISRDNATDQYEADVADFKDSLATDLENDFMSSGDSFLDPPTNVTEFPTDMIGRPPFENPYDFVINPPQPPIDEPPIFLPPIDPPFEDPIFVPPIEPPLRDPILKPPVEPPFEDPIFVPPIDPPFEDPIFVPPTTPPITRPPISRPPIEPPLDDPIFVPPIEPPISRPPISRPPIRPPIEPPFDDPIIVPPISRPPISRPPIEPPIRGPIEPPYVPPIEPPYVPPEDPPEEPPYTPPPPPEDNRRPFYRPTRNYDSGVPAIATRINLRDFGRAPGMFPEPTPISRPPIPPRRPPIFLPPLDGPNGGRFSIERRNDNTGRFKLGGALNKGIMRLPQSQQGDTMTTQMFQRAFRPRR
jgi:hypothetical protein